MRVGNAQTPQKLGDADCPFDPPPSVKAGPRMSSYDPHTQRFTQTNSSQQQLHQHLPQPQQLLKSFQDQPPFSHNYSYDVVPQKSATKPTIAPPPPPLTLSTTQQTKSQHQQLTSSRRYPLCTPCELHPDYLISNFCASRSCLTPLCAECIRTHSRLHDTQQISQTYSANKSAEQIAMNIDTIHNERDNCSTIVHSFLQKANEQRIAFSQNPLLYSQSSEQSFMPPPTQQTQFESLHTSYMASVNNAKTKLTAVIDNFFVQLVESISEAISKFNNSPTLTQSKLLIEQMAHVIDAATQNAHSLEQPQEFVHAILSVHEARYNQYIDHFKSEMNRLIEQRQTEQFSLNFDESKIYAATMELSKLFTINYPKQPEQTSKSRLPSQNHLETPIKRTTTLTNRFQLTSSSVPTAASAARSTNQTKQQQHQIINQTEQTRLSVSSKKYEQQQQQQKLEPGMLKIDKLLNVPSAVMNSYRAGSTQRTNHIFLNNSSSNNNNNNNTHQQENPSERQKRANSLHIKSKIEGALSPLAQSNHALSSSNPSNRPSQTNISSSRIENQKNPHPTQIKAILPSSKTLPVAAALAASLNRLNIFDSSPEIENNICLHYFEESSKKIRFIEFQTQNAAVFQNKSQMISCYPHINTFDRVLQIPFVIPVNHRSILSPSGYIFLTGGFDESKSQAVDTCYRFNPRSSALEQIPSMRQARFNHGITVCNEYLYVVGGDHATEEQYFKKKRNSRFSVNNALDTCERYNMTTNKWESISSLNTKSAGCCLISFSNRFVFKFGGLIDSLHPCNTIERYDIRTNEWREIPFRIKDQFNISYNFTLPSFAGAVQINEHEIFVVGGITSARSVGGEDTTIPFVVCVSSCSNQNLSECEISILSDNHIMLPIQAAFSQNPIVSSGQILALLEDINSHKSEEVLLRQNQKKLYIFDSNKWNGFD